MHYSRLGLYGGVALATLAMTAAPTLAQTTTAAPTTTPAAAPDNTDVKEIIVTATKRAESVQKVPISMTVLTGAKLGEFHATDIKSVMNTTPNVFVEQTAGNDVVYIRGFGSPPSNFSFDQSVSMYMDGVYMGHLRQDMDPFFDVNRVEVLRGPQGALFGKNTAAGAISIVSAGPTDHFEAAANGLWNFSQWGYDLNGYVSGPLTDTLGIRIAGRVENEDGYIRNRYNNQDDPRTQQQDIRVTLHWAPSPVFDDTLKLEYEHVNNIGNDSVSSSPDGPQDPVLYRYMTPVPLGQEGTVNKSFIGSNTANLHFGDYTVTSVTGYSWYNGNVINGFDEDIPGGGGQTGQNVFNQYPEQFHQISQEVRLLSPTGKFLEYIVGAYYDNSAYYLQQYTGFGLPDLDLGPGLNFAPYNELEESRFGQHSHSESVFGQATLHFTPWFRAIGSLRWTSTHKDGWFNANVVYGPFPLQPVDTVAQGSFTENHLDPSGTVQFDVAQGVMVYGTFGRGSKSGGFVSNTWGTVDSTFQYKPEQSRNFEAGVKFTVLDHKVVGSLSAYDTRFTNLQVSVFNPATQAYLTGNAASATSKGLEGALSYYPVHNFDLTATGAYMDIKYNNYPGASCLASQTIEQCNPSDPASIAANNLAGYRPPYTSKWTGSFQAHARFDIAQNKLDLTGVASGRSSYFDSDDQSTTYGFQHGYIKVDARIQFSSQKDTWHVAVVGKNLTDKLTTGSAFLLPAPITTSTRAILYVEPPRSISVEFGYKF